MPSLKNASLDEFSAGERHEMLIAAVDQENKKNANAHIFVVDYLELEDHLGRYHSNHQVIVNCIGHYTAVDIRVINGKKSCIILDSAMDPRGEYTVEKLKEMGFDVYFAKAFQENSEVQNIQFNLCGCSMFAFDHCMQFSYAQDELYQQLQKKREFREDHATYWSDFPPNFLWNAQSLAKILLPYEKMIQEQSPELLQQPMPNGLSYATYIQQGRIVVPVEKDGQVCEVERNDSINIHVFSKVLELFERRKKELYDIYKNMTADIKKIEAIPSALLTDQKAIIAQLKELQSDFATVHVAIEPSTSPFIAQFNAIVSQSIPSLKEQEAGLELKSKLVELKSGNAATPEKLVEEIVVHEDTQLQTKGYH